MSDNLAKIVNIIETSVVNPNTDDECIAPASETPQKPVTATTTATATATTTATATVSPSLTKSGSRPQTVRISTGTLPSYRLHEPDEVMAHKPTLSERCIRYLMVLIYICGLCSLGFVLSVYHIFFWDSRMPPVHKSMIMKKPPGYG